MMCCWDDEQWQINLQYPSTHPHIKSLTAHYLLPHSSEPCANISLQHRDGNFNPFQIKSKTTERKRRWMRKDILHCSICDNAGEKRRLPVGLELAMNHHRTNGISHCIAHNCFTTKASAIDINCTKFPAKATRFEMFQFFLEIASSACYTIIQGRLTTTSAFDYWTQWKIFKGVELITNDAAWRLLLVFFIELHVVYLFVSSRNWSKRMINELSLCKCLQLHFQFSKKAICILAESPND